MRINNIATFTVVWPKGFITVKNSPSAMMWGARFVEEREISLADLVPDPMNVRIDVGNVADLVASIQQLGFNSRLLVRRLPDGKYGVVCGSRRLYAARVAGLEKLPCLVYEMDDQAALLMSLMDNKAAKSLNNQELVEAYVKLVKIVGSIRKAAQLTGESHQHISDMLRQREREDEAERHGLVVSDMRRRESRELTGRPVVGKTTLQRIYKGLKRLRKYEGPKSLSSAVEPSEGSGRELDADADKGREVSEGMVGESLEKIVKAVWRPKLFKAELEGPYLHEVLRRVEVQWHIPQRQPDIVSPMGPAPFKGFFPAVTLDPPFENVTVMACPSCGKVLRSVGVEGAPVVCLECGFPSDRVWRKVGD